MARWHREIVALAAVCVPLLSLVARSDGAEPELVLSNQVYERDTTIVADRVIFDHNARITVKNGSHFVLHAKTLEFRGSAFIDGRGAAGAEGKPGAAPPSWKSCEKCEPGGESRCHAEWQAAGRRPEDGGAAGAAGGNGGPGANIDIHYETLRGPPVAMGKVLGYELRGGTPGKGGQGGPGRELRCGCHADEVKRGLEGAKGESGKAGKDGSIQWTAPSASRPSPSRPVPLQPAAHLPAP